MPENNSPISPEELDRIAAHAREGAEEAAAAAAEEEARRERDLTTDRGVAIRALDESERERKARREGIWSEPRRHKDYVWDKQARTFRDFDTGITVCAITVNGSIPQNEWRRYTHVTPTGQVRERTAKPAEDIATVEFGHVVDGATWWPGKPKLMLDAKPSASSGTIIEGEGGTLLNLYRQPKQLPTVPGVTAQPWLDHMARIYPDQCEYLLDYFAHTLQLPGIKINHGIVMSGPQGCGKDTLLVAPRIALEEMNMGSVAPDDFFSRFNPFVQRVLIVVDEWRALDTEHSLVQAYNRLKIYTSEPPAFHTVADKYEKGIAVPNIQRVVVTTNEPESFHVDADDRRWAMLTTDVEAKSFPDGYWAEFYAWGKNGGWAAVQQLLATRDASAFDPKAPPPDGDAKRVFVEQWSDRVEDDALDVALRRLENMNGGARPNLIYGKELLAALEDEAMESPEEKVVAEQEGWSEETLKSMSGLRARELEARKKELIALLSSKIKLSKRLKQEGYVRMPRPDGEAYWPTYGLPKRHQNRVLLRRKDYEPTPKEFWRAAEERLKLAANRF